MNKKIRTLNGTRFVIKPNIGQKGIDVRILKKEEIKNIKINKPMLVQEFIDGSHGVANIVKGIHDLRIIIFDKKIFGAFIRIPQKGSLIANITQGGSRIIIKKEDVPENVIDITKEVIKKFEHFDNLFYSIDFILDKEQKAYIIEINPNTGFTVESKKHGKFFDSYYKKVANFLLKVNVK